MTPDDIKKFREIRDLLQQAIDIANPVMDAIMTSEGQGGSLNFNSKVLDGETGIRNQVLPRFHPLIGASPILIVTALKTFEEKDVLNIVEAISNDNRFTDHKSFYAAILMYANPNLSLEVALAKADAAPPMEMRGASYVLGDIADRVYGTSDRSPPPP